MSGFEFVLVLYAIIAGLGISDILAGWAEQIRLRHRVSVYPLQIALSFLLLYYGISFLWSFWTFRDIVWTFSLYVTMAIAPLVISLASRLVRVDTSIEALSTRDQYFQIARPVFILLALIPALILLLSFTTTLSLSVPDRPDLIKLTILRAALCAGCLYIAWSRKVSVHWIGVSAMFLITLMLSMRLTVRAIDGLP
jgi:hypothetical protein